jgi:carbon-monoxide dehydrogenase large subunit
MERLIDLAARDLGLDPCVVRERNLISACEYPYKTPTGMVYDSGDFPMLVTKLKEIANYDALRDEQQNARAQGQLLGIGIATFTDYGGGGSSRTFAAIGRRLGSYEVGLVRVHPSGKVTIFAGTQNHGQGHETTYCQIVAEQLGCGIDDVELVSGDTERGPAGLGTWGSRSLVLAGGALHQAAGTIATKCRRLAAHLLDAPIAELDYADAHYVVRHTNRKVAFAEVAREAYHGAKLPDDFSRGLEEVVFYEPDNWVFSGGAHLAVVLVDRETGVVTVRDYIAVDDVGRMINPMIVEGQIHGGVVQGVGQALWEQCVYDPVSGQLLSGSFMDYTMPRAADVPSFRTGSVETPAMTPLGAKGAGESGCLGAPPAVVNAVVDALAPLGIRHIDMPLSSERVWRAMGAGASAA